MRCENFEARLNDVLDERRSLSSAPELDEHLRQCSACRELARAYEGMLTGLSYEQLPPAPVWLTDRIVNNAAEKTPDVKTPVGRPNVLRFPDRLLAFALAASVLIAAGVLWKSHSRERQLTNKMAPRTDVTIAHAAPNQASKKQPRVEVPGTPRAAPAIDDVAANGTENKAPNNREAGAAMGLLPGTDWSPRTDWAPAGAEWAQEVADGLEPVTRPTVGAISGFLNLWGIAEEGHRS